MPKPFRDWTVLPHGKLQVLDDNLLSVTGVLNMPLGQVERRMTVVRLMNGRVVVYSAIALDEAEMLALERWGVLSYLIVPNENHRLDAKIWKDRYPNLEVIAPPGARAKVEEVVHVNAIAADFEDPSVSFIVVPGTGGKEAALIVRSKSGTTLVLNDLIFNLANRPGFSGWLFKAMGMTGDEPHLPRVVKLREVEDSHALGAQFAQWSELPQLERVIVSHGAIIANEPTGVLGRIARELSA